MKKYIWVMPEKRDEEFSNELIVRFKDLAGSLKVPNFLIGISEQYSFENEPHYHLRAGIGDCSKICGLYISASYLATADEKKYNGVVNISMKTNAFFTINVILISSLFSFYDEYIRKFYPEWKTDYKYISLPGVVTEKHFL